MCDNPRTFHAVCSNCDSLQEVYFEIWFCRMNPDGRVPAPGPHGNMNRNLETACTDEYCSPDTATVDNEKINEEYLKSHEVHDRCKKCDHLIGD